MKTVQKILDEQDHLQHLSDMCSKLLADVTASTNYKTFNATTPENKGWLDKGDKIMEKVFKSCMSIQEQVNTILILNVDRDTFYKDDVSCMWMDAFPLLDAKLGLVLKAATIAPMRFIFDVHPAGEEEVGNVPPEMRYEVIIDKESGKNVSNMVDLILQLTGPSAIEANKKRVLLTTSAVK